MSRGHPRPCSDCTGCAIIRLAGEEEPVEGLVELIERLGTTPLHIFGVLIAAAVTNVVFVKISSRALARIETRRELSEARKKRIETLGRICSSLISILIWAVAALVILDELKVKIGPILAGAGIAGVAIGFGAQSMVRDFLSGFLILIENQFSVGDVVKIGDVGGVVESMTLRITVLRDLEGRVHIIPNGEIKVVTNMTRHFSWSVVEVSVAYAEDVDRVMELMKREGDELRADSRFRGFILEPMEMLGVESIADAQVTIRCRFKTLPIRQWEVAREFRRRLKKALDAEGVRIALPQRVIYFGRLPADGTGAAGVPPQRDSS